MTYDDREYRQQIAAILIEAADLVDSGWVQNVPAADSSGRAVLPYSRFATRWCASGAIIKAAGGPMRGLTPSRSFQRFLSEHRLRLAWSAPLSIRAWNDGQKQTQRKVAATLRDCAESRARCTEILPVDVVSSA